MKILLILLAIATVGCDDADDSPAVGPPRHTAQAHASPPQAKRKSVHYELDGLITGPRSFYDQRRCLAMLKVYADAMEVGLGNGSSAELKCVPQETAGAKPQATPAG